MRAAVLALALLGVPAGAAVAAGPPGATTGNATSVTQSGATVAGTVDPQGMATTYRFEYGTSSSYGLQTAEVDAGSGTGAVDASATLTGLTNDTTYHYRVVATNAMGTTAGPDQIFATLPASQSEQKPMTRCRKGFVRRHGKCVKRRKKHHRRSGHRHG